MCEWANSIDAKYLDGAIMSPPGHIGKDKARVIISGDSKTFSQAELILMLLAPSTRYVGQNPGSANLLDHALLSVSLCAYIGVVNGIALCEAGGAPLHDYRELMRSIVDEVITGALLTVIKKVSDDDLQNAKGNDLHGVTQTCEHLIRSANEMGSNSEVPVFFKKLLDRAETLGLAGYDGAALIEVMRKA